MEKKSTGNGKIRLVNIVILCLNLTALAFNVYFALELNWFGGGNAGEIQDETDDKKNIDHPESGINNYAQYLTMEVSKENFSWTEDSNDTKKIISLEYMNQKDYPTGCESVTTVMALRYMGYNISVDDFIDKYLPIYPVSWSDGYMYGEDPNLYFVGNPRDKNTSYGCYAPVIKSILVQMAGQDGVHNLTGMDIEDFIKHYIDNGIPVIMWATVNMQDTSLETTWKIDRTGENFTFPGREHCLLLAGYDDVNYYFYDPYENNGIVGYDKETVTKRYKKMGSMAVALVREAYK